MIICIVAAAFSLKWRTDLELPLILLILFDGQVTGYQNLNEMQGI
jgi:hypothetical protein